MKPNRIELVTILSPEQCVARLESVTETDWAPQVRGVPTPLAGRVSTYELQLYRRTFFINPRRIYFYGEMRGKSKGTVISGVFAMHPVERFTDYLWLGGAILYSLWVCVDVIPELLTTAGSGRYTWVDVLILPVIFLIGGALRRFFHFLARDDVQFIKARIILAIHGREMNQTR